MNQAVSTLLIDAVDARHPQALALLAEAAGEARALYPELFAADAPAPTNPPLGRREVYLLAWRDDTAVGCASLRQRDPFTAEVRRMFVSRAARRDGVARALLARLEQASIALGYRQLVLETGAKQAPAIALYEASGWRRIAPFGNYRGDPTSVCFAKSLPTSG